jgi:hypothetical protein
MTHVDDHARDAEAIGRGNRALLPRHVVAPPAWRVVVELGRREARLLVRHPATKVGVFILALAWFAVFFEDANADALFDPASSFGLPLILFSFSLIVGANLGALRTRRSGADELVESLPMTPAARTTGHLVGGIAGVPLTAAALVVALIVWQFRPETIGAPSAFVLLAVLFVVAGAPVVGVLVARWIPHAAFGAAAVIAVIVLQSNFGHESETYQWLHFLPMEHTSIFEVGPEGWHVVYLAALVLLGAGLALVRHGLSRPVQVVLAVALVGVVGTGWIQIRPLDASAVAYQADRLERPEAHQVCERHGGVRYCAYPPYRGWIDGWREPVEGVLARLPAAARPSVSEVRQRTNPSLELGGPVEARLDPNLAWRADGGVHPGTAWYREAHRLTLGYQTAARALGLPTVVGANYRACSAGGQARAVVALWLAGQATPAGGQALRSREREVRKVGQPAFGDLFVVDGVPDWMGEFPDNGADNIPELASGGRGADVVAAVALLRLPAERVGRVVRDHWDALRDPATPGTELFRLVGVPAPYGYAALAPVRPGLGQACR